MKAVVITTINPPTETIKRFIEMEDTKVYVIGDRKTPKNCKYAGTEYYSVEEQNKLKFDLLKHLPYNHYSRKMIGYLCAMRDGADVIIDSDDDNTPVLNWRYPEFSGEYETAGKGEFYNIYQNYSRLHIWPRGFPLSYINKSQNIETEKKQVNVGVWQGLVDVDPDVDAIYRLTKGSPCYFFNNRPVVLNKETACPYNSQNTITRKELFQLLYLPTTVSFRFTDILRGYVAQPIMWEYGYSLGFYGPTAEQVRNYHDFFKDFLSEIPMYEHSESIVGAVKQVVSKDSTMVYNMYKAYEVLYEKGIVKRDELSTLTKWNIDVCTLT